MSTTTRRNCTRALTSVGALLFASTALIVSAPTANAYAEQTPSVTSGPIIGPTAATSTATAPAPPPPPTFGERVLSIVSSRRGSPYVYGAAGPHRFDCSGLTMWTFARLHRGLPHSSSAQYGRTKHIRASDRRPGDLVFFHDGGGIYHVGIYAGHNQIWHAPYPGTNVRLERLWTSAVYYGRVR